MEKTTKTCLCGNDVAHCTCARETGLLILRIALAAVFIYHGFSKVMDMPSTLGFFVGMLHVPAWLTYIVAYGEVIFGAMMLFGVFARYAAVGMIGIMIGAIYLVHGSKGFNSMNGGWEYAMMLIAGSAAIALLGAGKWAVTHECQKQCSDTQDGGCCKDKVTPPTA